MRAVLFSIRPQHCFNIVQGLKGDEVRRTKPKIDVPFKGYIYCTKAREFFTHGSIREAVDDLYRLPNGEIKYGTSVELMSYGLNEYDESNFLNGKVIGEFICKEIKEYTEEMLFEGMDEINRSFAEEYSCLSIDDLLAYKGEKDVLSFIDISDLVIYDKPKELSEFYRECEENECENCPYLHFENTANSYEGYCTVDEKIPIKRAPQSYCFVEELKE